MNVDSETHKLLFHALGEAVTRVWSNLPQTVQQNIFDQAVMSQGEAVRYELATFLHDKHPRTLDSNKDRAMPEPDSLGG